MTKERTDIIDPASFVPSLAEVVKTERLEARKIRVATSMPVKDASLTLPRACVFIGDGEKMAKWVSPALRSLWRGSQPAPADIAQYPPKYVPMFFFIESHVLGMCEAFGDKTDGDFEEWFSNLRRRPDGRSLGPCHDQLWRVLALLLAMRPTSQAEYEAVVGQLARSASAFRMGHASRNYVDYLHENFG
jgi:hypothetical protein